MQKIHIYSKQNLFPNLHGIFMNLLSAAPVKKTAVFLLFILFSLCLSAQQKTKIILISSLRSHVITKTDITYLRNPVFKQDNAILTCDSAVFYTAKNYFEAYENVHINQADTINIYSDRLTYDGNSKLAHLTSNVRLIDKTSTLTTNTLDYSMVPKVGTYVDGGKIVNKDGTVITSKNGYYFANSRDAYFRYNAVVVTDQSTIKSDTLRYNTFTNWAYFYGPTNIQEKDGNLYTENGAYNTKTQYAYFGKNNLYTSGSRSMKGDSLYYDGKAGYGKAVKNITFRDTVDKMVMRGQLGFYYKLDQRTLVTRKAYAGMGTSDSIMVKDIKQPDSLWLGADTLETQMVLLKTVKVLRGPAIKKDNELGEEERDGSTFGKNKKTKAVAKKPGGVPPGGAKNRPPAKPDDKKKPISDGKTPPPGLKKDSLARDSISVKKIDSLKKGDSAVLKKPDSLLKVDSVLKKAILIVKKDSLKSDSVKLKMQKAATKTADKITGKIQQLGPVKQPAVKQLGLIKTNSKDSIPFNPLDTVRTRIIKAYHHVNVFKTNMQAKSDSLFYTGADSTLRWYREPIMWSQGSQQTGDTIYLQLRNKKLNSVQIIHNAFAVNVEPDSVKYNQVKGKIITGFFKDGALSSMYVDGNAETVYFTKTEDGKKYDKMNQTISSRLKVIFRNNEIADVVPIKDVEGATTPVAAIKQDVILTGFVWKPELRPRSKKDITNPKVVAKPKNLADKPGVKTLIKSLGKKIPKGPQPLITKSITDQLPAASGLIKQLTKKADSLHLNKIITPVLIDTAVKAMPKLKEKADSLINEHSPLKNQ